jgi:hypothetical protein
VANDKQLARTERRSGDADSNVDTSADSGGNATAKYPNSHSDPDNAKATNAKSNGYAHAHSDSDGNPYSYSGRNSLSVTSDRRFGYRTESGR